MWDKYLGQGGRPALAETAETAEVVHALDVVGMAVGEDEMVDLPDVVVDALKTEFRGCIDLYVTTVHHNVDGGAGAPVPWIGKVDLHIVGLCDDGHALGRARS